jgi:hypothetical protein
MYNNIYINTMTTLDQIAIRIIKEQEMIIGPIAWSEAGKVEGLEIDASHKAVQIPSNNREIIDRLVQQYEELFGRISHEVCREVVRDITSHMSPEEVPESLK